MKLKKMSRISGKVLAGTMALAMALSPAASSIAFAAANEQSNTGDQGVSITLNAAQTEVAPGGEIDYTVTVNTTEYEGEAKLTLSLGDSAKVTKVEPQSSMTGIDSGNITGTMTLTPDEAAVYKVTAKVSDDLTADAVNATASVKYDYDAEESKDPKSVTAVVSVNVKNDGTAGDEKTDTDDGSDENKTDTVSRLQDEPSVYLIWKDLNDTKDRVFRTSDVLPVSILITNRDSSADMKDVVVSLDVPEGFNVVENLDAQGIVSDKTVFTWHIEKIEKGGTFTIDLGFVPTAGDVSDEFSASAKVSYSNYPVDGKGDLETNVLKGTRKVPKADALAIKVLQNNTDGDIVASAGQNVAYSVIAVNNGDVDLKNVVIKGEIGSGLVYGRSDKTTVTQKDGVVTWTIDTLEANKSQTMMFGVTLPKSNLANSYTFAVEGIADDTAEVKSNALTMKTGSSDVVVEMYQKKSGMKEGTKDDMSVGYGETYTYVIVVENKGTAVADNVDVSTMIPGSLVLNQSSMIKGMTYNSSALKWNISDLEPGKVMKANIKVTAPVGVKTNTADSSDATVKKMTLNINSTLSFTDVAGNPGAADSNTLTTTVEKKEENKSENKNNEANTSNDKTAPVNNSGLDTIAVSKTTGNQMLAYVDKDTVHVTAKYTKLAANTHYTGTVGLVNESGGILKQADGSDATAHLDFTTSGTSGTIGEFDFVVDGKAYAGKCLYAAIDATPDGGKKLAYNGKGFDQSTIRSASVSGAAISWPTVGTSKTAQASVVVSYTNVQKGLGYRVLATLVDRSTGKALTKADGKEVTGTANFKATENKGQIDVSFDFGADDVKGKDLAVYVTLYDVDGKVVLAMDQDMNTNKTSGTAAINTSGSDAAKGDREIIKTGEMSPLTVILIFVGVCAMAGAGYFLVKKKNLLNFKKNGED